MDTKEMTTDEYYELPSIKIIKGNGPNRPLYPNPKIGKTYRNPNIKPTPSKIIILTTIIGIDQKKVPHFDYAYPSIIEKLHIEKTKIQIRKKEK